MPARTHAECIAQPDGLSNKGKQAYDTIVGILRAHKMLDTGGCKAFYSPQEWTDRGEEWGTKSELVLVYDGGSMYYVFNGSMYDEFPHTSELKEEIDNALAEPGLYIEECTCWYSAVYAS